MLVHVDIVRAKRVIQKRMNVVAFLTTGTTTHLPTTIIVMIIFITLVAIKN